MDSLLACGKAPDRLPYLSEREEDEVRRMLTDHTPAEEGMDPESYWDTQVLQTFLEDRFSVTMTRSGIGEMLKRWGFSYTRPIYHLVKADPNKQEAFQLEVDMIKKPSHDMIFLQEDETHIRNYQALHVTWAPGGQQKNVQMQGHHAKVTLFGAVDAHSGNVLCMDSPKCDAVSFLQFLQHVLEQHQDQYVVMALDNAHIHHAKLIQTFLEENRERLMLLFLPPYSPNLNLLERVWKWLKECVIANRYHATQADIRSSALSFLEHLVSFPEKVLQRMGRVQMLKD